MIVLRDIERLLENKITLLNTVTRNDRRVNKSHSETIDEIIEEYEINVELRWKIVRFYCLESFSDYLDNQFEILLKDFHLMFSSNTQKEFIKSNIFNILKQCDAIERERTKICKSLDSQCESIISPFVSPILSESFQTVQDTNPGSGQDFEDKLIQLGVKFADKKPTNELGLIRVILSLEDDDIVLLASNLIYFFLRKFKIKITNYFPAEYKEAKLTIEDVSTNSEPKKRGAPTKPKRTETLEDLWDNARLPFSNVIHELTKPLAKFDDKNFVNTENGLHKWNKVPSSIEFSKFIRSFLIEAYAFGLLDLKIKDKDLSGNEISKIFENTFIIKAPSYTFRNIHSEKKTILSKDYKMVFPFLKI